MWGSELWDQYDGVCSHLDGRLDQIKRISEFVKHRIKLEQDYAKELRKLNKSYVKMKAEETKFPSTECFSKLVAHTDELAHLHDGFGNKLQTEVFEFLKKLATDEAKEKKSIMADASKQLSSYHSALSSNDKLKKKYENAQQDSDKANMAYQKADADMALSRAAVEKIRKTSEQKQHEAEEARKHFQTSIEETNNIQREHFSQRMPEIFKQLQKLDEKRTAEMSKSMVTYINLESEILPGWTEAERKVKTHCEGVKPEVDSKQLVEEISTGLPVPTDLSFDDLVAPPATAEKRSKKSSQASTMAATSSTSSSTDLYENLPPNKRKKKLSLRLTELKQSSRKEEAELRALEKMTEVYASNPSLGDASVVQQKINPLANKCDSINEEAYRVECALAQLENRDMPAPPARVMTNSSTSGSSSSAPGDDRPYDCVKEMEPIRKRTSRADMRTFKRSPSQVSVGVSESMAADFRSPEPSREDTYDDSLAGQPETKGQRSNTTWSDDEFQDSGNKQCSVLYDFTASSDGELSVAFGETLELLQDDGSGWISVRRGNDQGYIPLSYVQMM